MATPSPVDRSDVEELEQLIASIRGHLTYAQDVLDRVSGRMDAPAPVEVLRPREEAA